MDSASFQFLLLGLAAAAVSNFSRSVLWRGVVLFLTSAIFICFLSHGFAALLPLTLFLVLGYAFLFLIKHQLPQGLPWFLAAMIVLYIWLKRYTFLPESILPEPCYLTLGLSYIFFRIIHLLVEAATNEDKRLIEFHKYLLYTLNFTTFISGPIQRYDEFARDQFANVPICVGPRVVGQQFERIIRGFFKVNVLAMLLNTIRADAISQMYQPLSIQNKLFPAFRLSIVYPLFLYSNFSGYIDIVIALARLMRVRLPENFNRPFSATSVIEFWNRWHMTLSSWLRTYVFTPLLATMMRRIPAVAAEPFLAAFCFFVTFFLIGIWHGRTTEFIFFGLLTGGGMSINELWHIGLARATGRDRYKSLSTHPLYESLGRGLNYVWFSFTLFWFWGSWGQIDAIFSALPFRSWLGVWFVSWLAASLVLACWEWFRAALLSIGNSAGPVLVNHYALVVYASAMVLVIIVVTFLLRLSAPPIVYKAF